jgi:hypothetical protein
MSFTLPTTTEQWLKGILAAAIGSAANAVTLIIIDPLQFNLFQGGAAKLGMACTVSAIVAVAMYLKQQPVPKDI